MADERPSVGTFVLAVAAIGLLAAALAMPWFSYDTSTGRNTAPGGFNDPENTAVERHHLGYAPYGRTGDVEPSDPAAAETALTQLSWALWAGVCLLALAALAEVPPLARWAPRALSLVLLGLVPVAAGAALWIGWFALPATLSGYGVTGPFTYFLSGSGYTRTTLEFGWVAAAAAVPFALGALLWKYQAGSDDLTLPATSGSIEH